MYLFFGITLKDLVCSAPVVKLEGRKSGQTALLLHGQVEWEQSHLILKLDDKPFFRVLN